MPAGTEELEIIGSVFGASVVSDTEDDTTTDTEDDAVVDTSESDITDTDQKVLTQCGPGTILQDGECVVESTPLPKSEYSFKGIGKEMIFGIVAAFIIAGTVGLVLAIMSKASKSS